MSHREGESTPEKIVARDRAELEAVERRFGMPEGSLSCAVERGLDPTAASCLSDFKPALRTLLRRLGGDPDEPILRNLGEGNPWEFVSRFSDKTDIPAQAHLVVLDAIREARANLPDLKSADYVRARVEALNAIARVQTMDDLEAARERLIALSGKVERLRVTLKKPAAHSVPVRVIGPSADAFGVMVGGSFACVRELPNGEWAVEARYVSGDAVGTSAAFLVRREADTGRVVFSDKKAALVAAARVIDEAVVSDLYNMGDERLKREISLKDTSAESIGRRTREVRARKLEMLARQFGGTLERAAAFPTELSVPEGKGWVDRSRSDLDLAIIRVGNKTLVRDLERGPSDIFVDGKYAGGNHDLDWFETSNILRGVSAFGLNA